MRNPLHLASFGLMLTALGAGALAAPAPPRLEALPSFRVDLDSARLFTTKLKRPSIDSSFRRLRQRFRRILDLSFSPDNKTLYTTIFEGPEVWLWDVSSRKWTDSITFIGKVTVVHGTRTSLSPDGKTAATWGGTRIALWDTDSRKILSILDEKYTVRFIAFSPDSKILSAYVPFASWNDPEDLRIWDISKKTRVGKCMTRYLSRQVEADSGVKTPLFVENDRLRFTLVDAFTGRSVITCEWTSGEASMASCFAMNRTETIVASAGRNSPVQLWDRTSGQRLARLKPLPNNSTGLAFSPDGKILAAFYDGLDRNPHHWGFVLYDVSSGKIRTQVNLPDERPVWAYPVWAFSPDGRLLAVKTNEEIKVWRIPDAWRRN